MSIKKIFTLIYISFGIIICTLLIGIQDSNSDNTEINNLLLDINNSNVLIESYSNLIKKIPADE